MNQATDTLAFRCPGCSGVNRVQVALETSGEPVGPARRDPRDFGAYTRGS